jgi:hypothetical protein
LLILLIVRGENVARDTPVPWGEIRQVYVTGDDTITALADRFGVSRQAISYRSQQESWGDARDKFKQEITDEACARVKEEAIRQRVKLYDTTRETAEMIIQAIKKAASDPEGFYKHVVQFEEEFEETTRANKDTPGHKQYSRRKYVDDKILTCLNGRNAADAARAIKDLSGIARILDGILEPRDQAKNDIEREKLELDKRQAGMSDDIEQESGIALLPGIDKTLLDGALPDPDQPIEAPKEAKSE